MKICLRFLKIRSNETQLASLFSEIIEDVLKCIFILFNLVKMQNYKAKHLMIRKESVCDTDHLEIKRVNGFSFKVVKYSFEINIRSFNSFKISN